MWERLENTCGVDLGEQMEKYLDIQRNKLSSHVGEAEFIAADQLCHSLNESSGASPLKS